VRAKFCGNHSVPMTGPEHRAQLGGIATLAAAMVLLELLSFRLCAATLGAGFAAFVGLMAPFAAALGAVTLARRSAALEASRLAKSTAYLAAAAGAFTVAGTVALSWVSQGVAGEGGEGNNLQVLVVLAGWLIPALLSGAALASAVRRGLGAVGRVGFAEAIGGVGACLLVPAAMWLGAPQAALSCALLFAIAAFCFAYVGRLRRPRWAVLVTLPLVVVVLVAGDMGAPWLRMRSDVGRRTKVELALWTPEGLITVEKLVRRATRFAVDRTSPTSIAKKEIGERKPRYHIQDIVYDLTGSVAGPVLIVGASGGRDVQCALAEDLPRVDLIAPYASLVNEVLMDLYAEVTDHLFADPRIHPQIGDGRAALASLPNDYARVVVLGMGQAGQTAPRLMLHHDRLFTVEAIGGYLERLGPKGALVMRHTVAALPALIATTVEAVGEAPEQTRERLFACADKSGAAALLLGPTALDPVNIRTLTKRCKNARFTVAYPLVAVRGKNRGHALAERQRVAQLAELEGGAAVFDERPLTTPPVSAAELPPLAISALRGLRPQVLNGTGKKGPKTAPLASKPGAGKEALGEAKPADQAPVGLTTAGITGAAAAIGLLALLVTLLVPAAQAGSGRRSAPILLRLSFPFFGFALSVCFFVLVERFTRLLGDGSYAWSLLIPLGLAALGAGRLWVDAVQKPLRTRTVMVVLGLGALWLLVLAGAARPLTEAVSGSFTLALIVVLAVMLISGGVLGAPLAMGLLRVRAHAPSQSTWCWGAHHAGWAFGAVLAALWVHAKGLSPLMPMAVGGYVLGAALFVIASGAAERSGASVSAPAPQPAP
jgi:hypothetical protein